MAGVYSEKDENPEYWFNLKTLRVEVGKKSPASFRVGPFRTREDAQDALTTIANRNRVWREEEQSD